MITGEPPMHRIGCPVCGREMQLPVHRNGDAWTERELYWAQKLIRGGVARKQVARLMDVTASSLAGALKALTSPHRRPAP